MVALHRRIVLVTALLVWALASAVAAASGQDVLDDYLNHNAEITECHTRADYDAARNLAQVQQYGDFPGAIDAALRKPELVGTPEAPCPDKEDGGSGAMTAALVLIPVAAIILGGAVMLARRGRDDDESGTGDAEPRA